MLISFSYPASPAQFCQAVLQCFSPCPFPLNSRISLPQAEDHQRFSSPQRFFLDSTEKHRSFSCPPSRKKKIPSYPYAACSIVMNTALFTTLAAWKIIDIQVRLLALRCNVFSFSLPSCSIPRTEFSCITAPVAYAATHYSNPMPTQTQAFSLPRNKRYSLPVDYRGFFACGLLSPALLWLTWFFLQTSPDTYYTYEPSLIFRAYRPLISICCLYC